MESREGAVGGIWGQGWSQVRGGAEMGLMWGSEQLSNTWLGAAGK